MFEKLQKLCFLNPLDRLCVQWKKEDKKKILILWNRGLGDIPLWLYGLCKQIKDKIVDIEISFLTRSDLFQVLTLLDGVRVIVSSSMQRGDVINIEKELVLQGRSLKDYDVVIEKIEPKKWLKWQRGWIIPRLKWPQEEVSIDKFSLQGDSYLAIHLSTETACFYDKEKNWPIEKFKELFTKIKHQKIILFGMGSKVIFDDKNILDLRGKTTFFEMLAIIKNHCSHLLAPDSGVLCSIYYLDVQFPLSIVSLWGDPNVGILKQRVSSPNKLLRHRALIGKKKEVKNVSVEQVIGSLFKKN